MLQDSRRILICGTWGTDIGNARQRATNKFRGFLNRRRIAVH